MKFLFTTLAILVLLYHTAMSVNCISIRYIIYNMRIVSNAMDSTTTTTTSTPEIPHYPKYDGRRIVFPKEDHTIPSAHEFHPTQRAKTLESHQDLTTLRPPMPVITRTGNSNEIFSAKLYQIMALKFYAENLVYSPISLQSILAILYLGAEHSTATQLRTALELPDSLPKLLNQFQSILSEPQIPSEKFQLEFAQKIYFKNQLILRYGIKNQAKTYFKSEFAPISFESISAVEEINKWVAEKTNDRITNMISSGTFDTDTELVLVNAIYLKAKWARQFSTTDTIKQNFFVNQETQMISVDMMYIEEDFKYGEFPDIDAKIVELPFLESELSMLIILPNKLNGLATMESRLQMKNLNELLEQMETTPLTVRIPKFRIESDLDMKDPLKKLGIQDIFTNKAELGKLFKTPNVQVSKIQHKAFINLNEGGLEAAAATFLQIGVLSLQPDMTYFTADHPFMFAIRGPKGVYFIGHVINNFQ